MSGGAAEEVTKIVRWMAAVCWSLRTLKNPRFTCLSMHHTAVLLFGESVTREVGSLLGCAYRQMPVFPSLSSPVLPHLLPVCHVPDEHTLPQAFGRSRHLIITFVVRCLLMPILYHGLSYHL